MFLCRPECRACNHSGRDLEEPCIADPDWEPDDDDLARREGLPAAPESDVRRDAIPTDPEGDRARHDAWVATLTDAERSTGIPYAGRRIFMEQDVERIVAERVRVVEGERDAAVDRLCDGLHKWREDAEHYRARAESAEAAHRALQAAVEALADEWASKPDDRCYDGDRARALRALLAGGAR